MRYAKLGNTGLDVSRLCLGCMSFGEPHRGADSWTLGPDDSRAVIRSALEAGVNFFDTANVYSDGSSEEIVGRVLRDHARRDEVVIATKVFGPMRSGPNSGGLSRKAILTEVEHSLTRLGTDYLDLYQIHRWDPATPVEETLAALDALVTSGKVRYLGASSMYAWQFAKALFTADLKGYPRFTSMQNHYNLLNREEEREMLPLCADQRVGVIPWSPLARGRLARPGGATTARTADDAFGDSLYAGTEEADRRIVDAVAKVAQELDAPMASVALAWLLRNPVVVAPIVGVTKPHHLDDALKALDLSLTDDQVAELESPYVPHRVAGFE
ncbi:MULTISPECIES: aldo/keto reductase [Saccharothrix]|uniref:aldo/keto reductase n=1 Tax=Saccharothrix TaxID=2071 RepID=UPI00093899D5|nr:aldo/keto reductase [Saccharothrix sp. CB00851]OKI21115.1 alcohol dehydrogenase [Saccharothrix sp. CB00851]